MNSSATNPSSTSQARLIVASIFLCIAMAASAFVATEVISSREEVAKAKQELAQKLSQQQVFAMAEIVANDTQAQRDDLSHMLVPKNGAVDFITQIESLGKTAGATASVSSVSGKPPKGTVPGNLVLTVQFSGSFAADMRYIELLETMPVSVSLSAVSLQQNEKKWSGALTLTVLSFDNPS